MGGTDDPSNIIELTVEQHAQAHYELWLMCAHWEDEIAWKALSGQIPFEEATKLAGIKSNLGKKHSQQMKDKISARNKKLHESRPEWRINLGKSAAAAQIGIPKTENHKKKMRGLRPHVNQTGGRNNNANPIKTTLGTFGSMSELLNKYGDQIPGSGTGKYRYIHKMIKQNIWSKI